jgi:glycosyltransferase involved in cell wall biosynthesis
VFFASNFSLRPYPDKGFGTAIHWDTPLTDGYPYEFLPRHPILLTHLKKHAIQVLWIHGYNTPIALQAILTAKALNLPVLLRAESWLNDRPRSPLKLLAKRLFFQALKPLIAGVLPIGTLNRAYWRHYLGEDIPMWLVPYAVDNDLFEHRTREASARRAELQAELNLAPTRPVLLFASKLQPRKRVLDLLDAYFALTPNHEPHPYLLIVGDGEDRPTLEARIAQAASKGVHSIRLCGFRNQSELPRFFDLATVFVLPSRHEPWGLVVNEAMASGTPVILSNEVGCHPDLLTDGIEGYLLPAGNLPALTEALHKILEDSERAARMGQNALARIRPWSIEADIRSLRQAIFSVAHKHVRPDRGMS